MKTNSSIHEGRTVADPAVAAGVEEGPGEMVMLQTSRDE